MAVFFLLLPSVLAALILFVRVATTAMSLLVVIVSLGWPTTFGQARAREGGTAAEKPDANDRDRADATADQEVLLLIRSHRHDQLTFLSMCGDG